MGSISSKLLINWNFKLFGPAIILEMIFFKVEGWKELDVVLLNVSNGSIPDSRLNHDIFLALPLKMKSSDQVHWFGI